MTTFGEVLRSFRQRSNDPDRQKERLSQSRLGELIGHELEDRGFSGAAISDWERGKGKISAEDRKVLLALTKVLHHCGGLRTPQDANQLLEAGNYRALNREEVENIFGETLASSWAERPNPEVQAPQSLPGFLLANLFSISEEDWQSISAKAKQGPSPAWPRLLAVFMRKASERWSLSLRAVLWVWVWLLAWWLTAPSLRWPFIDREAALSAIGMYVAGTLVIPLLVGLLINTEKNEYWRQCGMAKSTLLRLYTYQGAGIGFNLGYFFVLPWVLIRYYLHLEASFWLEFAAVTLGLVLANMSARVVPYNLWVAYGRLRFADGGIFFMVALLGPLWGMFFMQYYPLLLSPLLGSILILLAMTGAVLLGARQTRGKFDHK